jgi:tripartite-type tricarboxylate transporter receptor subunit TctC
VSRRARGVVKPIAALALAAFLLAASACACAAAQWPERPIRLIVPFQAGSSSDTVARIVAHGLAERLKQQFVVENRVGASGNVGTGVVAHADPDGYTLGLANTSTHASAVSLSAKLTYDPVKDFAAVGMIGSGPFVLSVHPGLPAATLQDLIALAKAKPGQLSYASAGPASMAHLAGALLEKMADIGMVHVPYRGSGQSVLDVVEGRIDMQFGTIPPTLSLVHSGQVRALAVTGARRNPTLAEVPAIAETVPGYEASLWQAIVAPAGTPAPIVMRLNQELVAVLGTPQIEAALAQQGLTIEPGTPDELAARIRADVTKWGELIRSRGIAAQ